MKKTKMGRPRTQTKTTIQFLADKGELEAAAILEQFYGYENHHALLHQLLVLAVIDVSNLPEDKSWTPKQKKAWQYCRMQGKTVDEALILGTAKLVLAELETTNPTGRYTKRELALMTRGRLAEMAEGKGISIVGRRKSGIIEKLMEIK